MVTSGTVQVFPSSIVCTHMELGAGAISQRAGPASAVAPRYPGFVPPGQKSPASILPPLSSNCLNTWGWTLPASLLQLFKSLSQGRACHLPFTFCDAVQPAVVKAGQKSSSESVIFSRELQAPLQDCRIKQHMKQLVFSKA